LVTDGSVAAEIHHIKARRRNHPQYDANQTDKERHGIDNLIVLCSNCHDWVHDDPERYPTTRLRDWKTQHENPQHYEKILKGRRLAQGEEPLPLTSVIEREDARVTGYLQHLDEKVSAARMRGNFTMLREHLEIIAHVHETARAWSQAVVPLRELCHLYFSFGDFTHAIRASRRLGYALLRTENLRAARAALRQGLFALRRLPSGAALKARAQLFELLGMAYLRDGLPRQALHYLHEKALPDRRLLKAPLGIASTMSRMGLVYSALGKHEKALVSVLNALRIRYSTNAKTDTGRSLRSLGIIHQTEREFLLAAFVFRICLRWQEGCQNPEAQALAHLKLAEVFTELHASPHLVRGASITFRRFPFPNRREKSLLTKIVNQCCPQEKDQELPVSQLAASARLHYRESLRVGAGRIQQRVLREIENRLADM
jgi:tetratricopeptide (TPR) repeat protein